jgi:hypothetical protein
MGATGVATGALTGEAIDPLPPPSNPPFSSNWIVINDPLIHTPKSVFTTDANGELTMEAVPPPGVSEVAVKIGDETFIVDLTEASTQPGAPVGAIDPFDFTGISSGYQSTATLTPDFGSAPIGPVDWSVASVTNPTGAFWLRGANDRHGLTWGPTADGATNCDNVIEGTAPHGPTAQLTDVVGGRTVIVEATANVGGATATRTMTINFGPGPISVFSGTTHADNFWANQPNSAFPSSPVSDLGAPRL